MKISTILKQLRESEKITQKELALRTGISLRSIINYENGLREPNSKAMAALERYFNVSGDYLRGEIDKDTFYQESEAIQSELDKLISLFMRFKNEFIISNHDNQLIAIKTLDSVISTLSKYVLHNNSLDISADDMVIIFESFFSLNCEGRKELLKRIDELQKLQKYHSK